MNLCGRLQVTALRSQLHPSAPFPAVAVPKSLFFCLTLRLPFTCVLSLAFSLTHTHPFSHTLTHTRTLPMLLPLSSLIFSLSHAQLSPSLPFPLLFPLSHVDTHRVLGHNIERALAPCFESSVGGRPSTASSVSHKTPPRMSHASSLSSLTSSHHQQASQHKVRECCAS